MSFAPEESGSGKPGDLQVRPLLQPPSGGRGDPAGFEELGQLGVLRGDEIALQLPLGYGARSGGGGPRIPPLLRWRTRSGRSRQAGRIVGLRPVQVGSSAAARLLDSHRLKSAVLQLR
jgi:hypothetical protein